jgi:hypothetical protein
MPMGHGVRIIRTGGRIAVSIRSNNVRRHGRETGDFATATCPWRIRNLRCDRHLSAHKTARTAPFLWDLRIRQGQAQAPEVPTVDEAGLPGFYLANWSGLWAPKGTRQGMLSPSSILLPWTHWPMPQYVDSSPIKTWKLHRPNSRRRKDSAPFTRLRSRNGGRLSRRRA